MTTLVRAAALMHEIEREFGLTAAPCQIDGCRFSRIVPLEDEVERWAERAKAAERRLAMLREPSEELVRVLAFAALKQVWGHEVSVYESDKTWPNCIRAVLSALSAEMEKAHAASR